MAEKDQWMNSNLTNETGSGAVSAYSGMNFFEIRVKGQLNIHWSEWLGGLEMKLLENGEMIIFGPIVDQAALMGILNKISHLNLAILSVNELKQ